MLPPVEDPGISFLHLQQEGTVSSVPKRYRGWWTTHRTDFRIRRSTSFCVGTDVVVRCRASKCYRTLISCRIWRKLWETSFKCTRIDKIRLIPNYHQPRSGFHVNEGRKRNDERVHAHSRLSIGEFTKILKAILQALQLSKTSYILIPQRHWINDKISTWLLMLFFLLRVYLH
jgi:hypothetical protein